MFRKFHREGLAIGCGKQIRIVDIKRLARL